MADVPKVDSQLKAVEPSALAGDYLRAFAGAVGSISDFESFLEALKGLIAEDPFFESVAELVDPGSSDGVAIPDFEALEPRETVVAVAGEAGNLGSLKYSGRRDGSAYGAEDMHLMGSIAGFVSALVSEAHRFRKQAKAEKVLQYLINQLPLGVICFDNDGRLIVGSNTASRLLGEDGVAPLSELATSKSGFAKGKAQLHFEFEGRFIYAEGRRLEVEEGLEVVAFVLYDLSGHREKLLLELERAAYRSESRSSRLTLALLEDKSEPGAIYRKMRGLADRLQLEPAKVQSVDAYSCACVFSGIRPRTARYLLKKLVDKPEMVRLALTSYDRELDQDSPADSMVNRAAKELDQAEKALMPVVGVLDPYPGVYEALGMMTSEVCQLAHVEDVEVASEMIRSGDYDGFFIDLDSYEEADLRELKKDFAEAGEGFRVFYCSHKQPSMVRETAGLGVHEVVFQKPFQADKLLRSLALKLDMA